jgi:ABC-type branched-subunit amino acid transport system ATPase component
VRKRQSLADAQALSLQILMIDAAILERRLTPATVDEIFEIVARMRALEKAKIIVVPLLLQRVKAIDAAARRFRTFQAQEDRG